MHLTKEPHYCYHCGSILVDASDNGYFREQCKNCGEVLYRQHKVGIAAVIFQNEKLLLLRRAQEPWRGYWNLPAGFLEYEETLEEGVIREVFEEAGLQVQVNDLRMVFKYWDDPRGNGIVLFYDCQVLHGDFIENDEVEAFQYFALNEIPTNIAGAGHQSMIDTLKKEGLRNA
ncbi:MAG: NUDIX domain-containing protein [Anaerolineaceae bacterium]|nr:NUDIX domain-containing protein [Anaerolineaceae bacterium]